MANSANYILALVYATSTAWVAQYWFNIDIAWINIDIDFGCCKDCYCLYHM